MRQMLDHAREALEYAADRSRSDLDSDRTLQLVLTRLVEVIGEAARRVPALIRDAHPTVPWRQIVGTRDRLIHGYDQIDHDLLWSIIRDDLQPLISKLEAILGPN